MARLGRLPSARPTSAVFAKGLVFVALMLLHGSASARQAPGRGGRRPVDQAARRAHQLFQQIKWEQGPATADLGAVAELRMSQGFVFTGTGGARLYLELVQTPAPENLLGLLGPLQSSEWFVTFGHRPKGPEDNPKRKPDADALLRALRQEEEGRNAIRRGRGWEECKNIEWELPPSYEGSRHDLTWATRFDILGRRRINYTTRVFGRHEVIEARLVVDPKDMARVAPTVTNFLSVLEFKDVLREGGPRPGEEDVNRSGSSTSTSTSTSYTVPSTVAYRPSPAVGSSLPRSRGLITGTISGLAAAIGAAFKKKRRPS